MTSPAKRRALEEVRAFHAGADRVQAEIFRTHAFFDPEDKAQVKYEMLRRREFEGDRLQKTCAEFGFTRESYRHILERFRAEGMGGLFDRKRGRREPLKVTDEVRSFVRSEHARDPSLNPEELGRRCGRETGVPISRRTIYRVLAQAGGQKKKRRRKRRRRRRR